MLKNPRLNYYKIGLQKTLGSLNSSNKRNEIGILETQENPYKINRIGESG